MALLRNCNRHPEWEKMLKVSLGSSQPVTSAGRQQLSLWQLNPQENEISLTVKHAWVTALSDVSCPLPNNSFIERPVVWCVRETGTWSEVRTILFQYKGLLYESFMTIEPAGVKLGAFLAIEKILPLLWSTLVNAMDGILFEKKYALANRASNKLWPFEALDLKTSQRDIDTATKTIATIDAFSAITMVWQQSSLKIKGPERMTRKTSE
jgi:hypothetical protein